MEKARFRKSLLRSAVFTMACDGEVHDEEVASIREMASDGVHFADFDAESEVQAALNEVVEQGEQAIENHLDELGKSSFTEKQEQLIYEVLLQVVYADEEVHSNEREFLLRIREELETDDQTLIINFPTHLDLLLHNKSERSSSFLVPGEVSEVNFSEGSGSGNFTQ